MIIINCNTVTVGPKFVSFKCILCDELAHLIANYPWGTQVWYYTRAQLGCHARDAFRGIFVLFCFALLFHNIPELLEIMKTERVYLSLRRRPIMCKEH